MEPIRHAIIALTIAGLSCCTVVAMDSAPIQTTPAAKTKSGGGGRGNPGGTPGKAISGEVTIVSASAITIKTKDGDKTFEVNDKTKVQDHAGTGGAGGKGDAKPAFLIDLVKTGDRVTIGYQVGAAATVATSVRFATKSASK